MFAKPKNEIDQSLNKLRADAIRLAGKTPQGWAVSVNATWHRHRRVGGSNPLLGSPKPVSLTVSLTRLTR